MRVLGKTTPIQAYPMFLLIYPVVKHFMARRGKISLTQINLKCTDLLKNVRAANSNVFLYKFALI